MFKDGEDWYGLQTTKLKNSGETFQTTQPWLCSFEPEIWQNAAFAPMCTENILKTELFKNDSAEINNDAISLHKVSLNTKPKWTVIARFSNLPGVVWTENIWRVFKVKTPFSDLFCDWGRGFRKFFWVDRLKDRLLSFICFIAPIGRQKWFIKGWGFYTSYCIIPLRGL